MSAVDISTVITADINKNIKCFKSQRSFKKLLVNLILLSVFFSTVSQVSQGERVRQTVLKTLLGTSGVGFMLRIRQEESSPLRTGNLSQWTASI